MSSSQVTIFTVLIVGALILAVMLLSTIIDDASGGDENYKSPIDAGSIDQATLERINQLHTSDATVPAVTLPEGRINPFGE